MNKRSFLAPLALSVATLMGATANATVAQYTPVAQVAVEHSTFKVAEKDFVLTPGRNADRAQQFAYHSSHASHASHASHSSHYSSRY